MGAQAVGAIKPEHVQQFVNHLERKLVSRSGKGKQLAPMSPAGVRFVYQILFQILDLAYHSELTTRNPCSRLVTRPPAPRRRQRKMQFIDALETVHSAPDPLQFPLFCGLILGLRLGEIAGLKWSDLDRVNAVLWIERQVTHQGSIEPLKTDGSYRPIPLRKDFVEFLDRTGNLDSEFMSPLRRRQITYQYNRWKERPHNWTFHDTRHGAAAIMLAASGNDVLAAKELLGHAKLETTMLYIADDADRIRAGFAALPTVLPTVRPKKGIYGGE
jgi:integrase